MRPLLDQFGSFLSDERGATAIEYGLVALLISTTIIVWTIQIGQSVRGFFVAIAGGFGH